MGLHRGLVAPPPVESREMCRECRDRVHRHVRRVLHPIQSDPLIARGVVVRVADVPQKLP